MAQVGLDKNLKLYLKKKKKAKSTGGNSQVTEGLFKVLSSNPSTTNEIK
jgi:hypothetical protein